MFPNNDPVAFMVAFYGCLLAEVVPVPIEVPLSRKVPSLRPLLLFSCTSVLPGNLVLSLPFGTLPTVVPLPRAPSRMPAVSRSDSCWAAVALPWR